MTNTRQRKSRLHLVALTTLTLLVACDTSDPNRLPTRAEIERDAKPIESLADIPENVSKPSLNNHYSPLVARSASHRGNARTHEPTATTKHNTAAALPSSHPVIQPTPDSLITNKHSINPQNIRASLPPPSFLYYPKQLNINNSLMSVKVAIATTLSTNGPRLKPSRSVTPLPWTGYGTCEIALHMKTVDAANHRVDILQRCPTTSCSSNAVRLIGQPAPSS